MPLFPDLTGTKFSLGAESETAVRRGRMVSSPLNAVHVVWLTAFHLHLNCCMGDSKIVLELLRHRAEHVLSTAHALLINHDVAATTNHAGSHGPNVQVMHCQDAVHVPDYLLNLNHVHPLGNSLQQHVDRLFKYPPRTPKN